MPAPLKKGLIYFSHDVDMGGDQKVEYLESMHGLIGYAVYLKLLETTYRNGYYLPWGQREGALFAKRNNMDLHVCEQIVETCLAEGLFDKDQFEKHGVLTSSGIQRRYLRSCHRRTGVTFRTSLCCLEVNVLKNLLNESIILIKDDKKAVNHTKVKESKGKERKFRASEKKSYAEFVTMTEEQYLKLLQRFGKKATEKAIEILNNHKGAHGKAYRSDYHAILSWAMSEAKNQLPKGDQGERKREKKELLEDAKKLASIKMENPERYESLVKRLYANQKVIRKMVEKIIKGQK